MKCYDVRDLGMKFERCFDSEAVAFEYLSDDYSKLLFLHCDRYVSLHAQYGYYYRDGFIRRVCLTSILIGFETDFWTDFFQNRFEI